MEKKKVWVVGHRHPDTDSICAAIAYANLKSHIGNKDAEGYEYEYIPMRAGEISAETALARILTIMESSLGSYS